MSDRSSPPALEDYPAHKRETLRFVDTDRQGHVNNAVFATLCESGRATVLYDPDRPLAPPGTQFVIARLTLNFIEELNWPGEVLIGTGVGRLGRSSIGVVQGIFDGERCVATAESVIVLMDDETRRSTPLPEETRKALEGLSLAVQPSGLSG